MKILIIGAGLVGLTLYRKCLDANFDATIIEKQSHPSKGGTGICLPANALLELDKIGLKKAVLSESHQVHQISYTKANGAVLGNASLNASPLNLAPFVALPRDSLYNILLGDLQSQIQWATEAKELTQSVSGVNIQLNTGEHVFYDLVIAADGIHSSTRQKICNDGSAQPLGVSTWRFIADSNSFTTEPCYYIGDDHAFMSYPLGSGKFYCYAQVSDPEQKWANLSPGEALNHLFKHYTPSVKHAIEHAVAHENIHQSELYSVKLQQATYGNVALVGDALHGCPPALQQGLGMGLRDVNTLVSLLLEYEKIEALERYNTLRLSEIKWIIDDSNKVIRMAEKGKSLIGRIVRNYIIRKKGPLNVLGWKKILELYYR